ncbi:MAG: transporter substrate-binding domain-containing protein, partial [Xanthobacteraceae bacterium]|jgi:ABC-type amino acid transport substrate-binding protein
MTLSRLVVALAGLVLFPLAASAQDALKTEIAPTGKLRVALIGVRVLGGVGEPVGRFLAERLGLPFEAVTYHNPQAYEESFAAPAWDVAIGPRVLAPADKADVTSDAWLVELLYLAAPGHTFAGVRDVDRGGIKIGTIQNSPSDRFLTHNLKSATLVRLPLSPKFPADAIDMLHNGTADVFGADSGLIAAISGGFPEAKIVPGAFNTVRVAFALPKGRSAAAQARLAELLAEAKRTGVVQKAIEQAGLKTGVRVAQD